MPVTETLVTLRRRWYLVVLCVLVGAGVGWVTAPGGAGPTTYQASVTLIVRSAEGQGVNLQQAVLLTRTGPVPRRAAAELDIPVDELTRSVSASASSESASVSIRAEHEDRQAALARAQAVADSLVREHADRQAARYEDEVQAARDEVARLEDRVEDLQEAGEAAAVELNAASSQLASARQHLEGLEAAEPPAGPLVALDEAQATRASAGLRAPSSKPARAALLGGFGLVVGAAAALVADRLDTRIWGKSTMDEIFDAPLLAEIPPLTQGRGTNELHAVSDPSSPFVESIRALRTVLLFSAVDPSGKARSNRGRIILVTSPNAGEGKTTTVANLAAMLAETNRRVLVLSADFRRPHVHDLLGVAREPGLTDVLSGRPGAPKLSELDLRTSVPDVLLVPSGGPVDTPATVIDGVARVLAASRELFDVILVDSPPLLVANDSTELARMVDDVVVLCRAGRTTIDSAKRARELLERVDAPLLGTLLVSSRDSTGSYAYYQSRYYYRSDDGKDGSRKGRRGRPATRRSAADGPQAAAAPTNGSSPARPTGQPTARPQVRPVR